MVSWLKRDLAANPTDCTLTYWHHPLFSSGEHGNETRMRTVWSTLYRANADVVVNGHDHNYERFAPQTPGGKLDPSAVSASSSSAPAGGSCVPSTGSSPTAGPAAPRRSGY